MDNHKKNGKRGRKPKSKVVKCSKVNAVESVNKNIIVNLPVKLDDIISDDDCDSHDDIGDIFMEDNSLFMNSDVSTDTNEDINCKCNEYKKKIKGLNIVIENLKNELDKLSVKNRCVHKMDIDFVKIDGDMTVLPDSTDIWCWWCFHPFECPPCFLPDKYFNGKYYVFGCFCSYNCALAYNYDMNDYKINERTTLLNNVYREITGNNSVVLKRAGDRQTLKVLGGTKTIEEFRMSMDKNIKEYRFILPPMTSIIPLIEEDYREKKRYNYDDSDKYIPIDCSKVLMASNNLKLQRLTPLPNSKNSLEKTMGLRRKN